MNTPYRIPEHALNRLRTMVDEGRIVRGEWQSTDERGRETACLFGALGLDTEDLDNCQAEYMPRWLAHLTRSIGDSISKAAWPNVVRRYADLAGRWHVLDEAAWRRVLLTTLGTGLDIAQPYDTAGVVAPVRVLIAREMAGDVPKAEEWQAAAEARAAAAWAAWAATARAAAAMRAAAAEARAAAAEARAAARSSAWDRIACALLDAIEAAVVKGERG